MDEGMSACYNLAQIYKTMGDDENADVYFNRAVAIKEEHKRRDEEAKRTLNQETADWVWGNSIPLIALLFIDLPISDIHLLCPQYQQHQKL